MLKNYPAYKWMLAACDYTLLLVSWTLAILIRFSNVPLLELLSRPLVRTQGALILVYSLVWIVIFQHFGLYKLDLFMSFGRQLIAIGKSLVYGLLGLVLITFLFKRLDFVESRLVLGMFVGISVILIMTFRGVVVRRVFPRASKSKVLRRRVLIIGRDRTAKTVAAQIAYDETHGFEVVGFVNDGASEGERIFGEFKNVGGLSGLNSLVDKLDIDEIIIAESDVTHAALLTIIDLAQATRANVRLVSELYNIIPEKVLLEKYLGVPVVKLPQNYDNTLFNVYKRVFDVVMTVLGLAVLAVPMLVIAAIIKMTSKGRVLHTQIRMGKNCQPFTFYKFRTMKEGTDDAIHKDFASQFIGGSPKGVQKMTHDPRVTGVGRFLRKTSLDELPQLFNVLTGEMSLVGPRPCMSYELDQYEEWHRRRLSVKPGCTGLWQVAGRSAVDFNDMVILDLFYIDNMSPLFDLRIIFRTLPVMLLAKGGY